jgi:hypothetical protein
MTQATVTYRGYELVIKAANGVAQCWAWKDKKAPFKERGESLEAVEQAVRAAIDAELGPAPGEGDAAVAAYITAFEALMPITEGQQKMLRAHYRAPERTITAAQLAKAAGYVDFRGANAQYGILGRLVYEQHPVDLPRRRDDSLVYTFSIADPEATDTGRLLDGLSEDEEAQWRWVMRPAVAEALRAVGIVKR